MRPAGGGLAADYETVVYDVRGHGRTGGSGTGRYSVELFADDLAALLEALDLAAPVVCGHSTGGCIAQAFAARSPERLSGLVLASMFTPPYLSRAEWVQRSLLLRAAVPPVRLLGYERVERAMVWLHERLSPGASGDYGNVERLRAAGPKMETAEFAKVVRAVARFHETDLDLSAVGVPTLVLYGEHEPPFVRQHVAALAAALADVTVREVPGAGHASNLDEPAFFSKALREFLAGIA